jgi:DNA-binding NarL/FixJ family response regulator
LCLRSPTTDGHQVCAAVADGDAPLAAAEHRPDIVIVDIRMPPSCTDEGLRAALELRRARLQTAVLVLSRYIEARYASSLPHGSPAALGYLLKDRVTDVDEFTNAVSQLLAASGHSGSLDRSTRANPTCSP